jgi:nucleotide-binding universal stress UspA family protein
MQDDNLNYVGPRVVVVGYDGSPASRNALAYAIGMVRRDKGEVAIVEVYPPLLGTYGMMPTVRASKTGCLTPEVIASLDELLPGCWRIEVCEGDVVVELEKVCDRLRSDAIVVGRCRSPVRHPMGSVTGRLIRHTRRPVIVVP